MPNFFNITTFQHQQHHKMMHPESISDTCQVSMQQHKLMHQIQKTMPQIQRTEFTDALKKQRFWHTPLQKPALRVHWLVPKQPNSSRNRAQHAFPAQRPESLTLRTDTVKKTKLLPHLPIAETSFESPLAGSETAEQQQESCPTCLPSTAPPNLKRRVLTPQKKQSLCHTYLLQKPALRVHWLVAKQPNSSRNRARHAFPAHRPECLTSRTDALKKTKLKNCHS